MTKVGCVGSAATQYNMFNVAVWLSTGDMQRKTCTLGINVRTPVNSFCQVEIQFKSLSVCVLYL